jgi:hypothetical protein
VNRIEKQERSFNMAYYDEHLQLLQQQITQKRREESKLKELNKQREVLSARVSEFQKNKLDQQADVDQLEGHSLATFFYAVIGKKEERLDKEREEAYAAKVKYDVAARELFAIEEDILRSELELNRLKGSEQQYEKMLKNKAEEIKITGSNEAEKIFQAEERIAYIENQLKEMNEALAAGEKALSIIDRVLSNLDSAEGWGTWDLMGGGLISGMAKHSHLDEAQKLIEDLQVQLRRFKTELTDVTIDADIQVSIDGFLHFADYFFDGLFADWAVLDKINQSKAKVEDTKDQIERVLNHLKNLASTSKAEMESEKVKLNDLVVRAVIDK